MDSQQRLILYQKNEINPEIMEFINYFWSKQQEENSNKNRNKWNRDKKISRKDKIKS